MPSVARAPHSSIREWLGVCAIFAVLTTLVTWPQVPQWLTHAPGHHDALFSMWRLSWIADALTSRPAQLFDAPIFHPEPRTLAFSDAVLLQGLIATPALAAGAPVLPVYNVLLLLGPWTSCLAAYLLVRSLLRDGGDTDATTGGTITESTAIAARGDHGRPAHVFWPGVIAGAIFGLLPYRIEHVMHLELQWSQWMPLACWAFHRTVRDGRVRDGVLTAAFALAQFLSCIYYGVFLLVALAVSAPIVLLRRRRAAVWRIARALAIGAVVCAGPLLAYAAPYRANQAALGGRGADEIAMWSATPGSFVSAPEDNRLYGVTASLGLPEGRLLPGATALVLAVVGLWTWRRRPEAAMYVVVLVASSVLALGTHTPLYRLALAIMPPLTGLRAPARFGMIAALGLAVLAGLGAAWLLAGASNRMRRHALGIALVVLVTSEYASDLSPLHAWPQRAPLHARWLRSQPPGAVLDLPIARANALPLHEAEWSFYARFHGRPTVNGYSGYYPPRYIALLGQMVFFPNEESLAMLRQRGVRYIVVHEDRYAPEDFMAFEARLRRTPGLRAVGRVPDEAFPVSVFTLDAEVPASAATAER